MPDGSPPPHPDPALPHDVGCLGLDRTRPRRAANDAIDPMLHFENCCPTRVGVQTTAEGWQRRHGLVKIRQPGQICLGTSGLSVECRINCSCQRRKHEEIVSCRTQWPRSFFGNLRIDAESHATSGGLKRLEDQGHAPPIPPRSRRRPNAVATKRFCTVAFAPALRAHRLGSAGPSRRCADDQSWPRERTRQPHHRPEPRLRSCDLLVARRNRRQSEPAERRNRRGRAVAAGTGAFRRRNREHAD